MPVTDSPLRYPGGKTQLAPFVVDLMRANDLFYGAYVEPFAGGCGIAWKLLLQDYVSEVWINDIDRAIYAFWATVLRRADDLCELIETTNVTIEEWHRQRGVQTESRPKQLALGFSTLFLNRTNRSGILKGGVIGGLSQGGDYLLDCRFNKSDLIRKIQRISERSSQIKLTRLDAAQFIAGPVKCLPRKSLINVDPPYYKKGPGLYCSFYEHADHAALAEVVSRIKQPWMVTYDDVQQIRDLYRRFPMLNKELNYFAQVKRVGVELMIFDKRLKLPVNLVARETGSEWNGTDLSGRPCKTPQLRM